MASVEPTSVEHPSVDDPTGALTADFSQTARALFAAGGVEDTLAQIAILAVDTIEGCDYAGLFLVEGDTVVTSAQTDPLVTALDSLQRDTAEGPCLDAISTRLTVYGDDLGDDARWPRFGAQARELGIRSLLALPLFLEGDMGALNLYARSPQAFGVIDRGRGLLLAALAALALTVARTYDDTERRVANLQAAIATREVIGQAQGILMERERITADHAFDILRRASQQLNIKLRQVAQNLVDTGERPVPKSK